MKRSRIYDEEAHSGALHGAGLGSPGRRFALDGRGAVVVLSCAQASTGFSTQGTGVIR
jgi:hypothetical protein